MSESLFAQENASKDTTEELRAFMAEYQKDYHKLYGENSYAWWDSMTTGSDEAFKKSAAASLAMSTYHSDTEKYKMLKSLRANAKGLTAIEARAAEKAEKAFEQNQFPPELMRKMTDLSSEIEQIFQVQRPVLDDKEYTNNDLLEMIEKETDSKKRYEIWCALKQVGDIVAPKIIELAKLRNEAAQCLGYKNYWEMSVVFQNYDPDELCKIFEELEVLTRPIFVEVKKGLDDELKERFSVDRIMPWHYDNPFFQQAPASKNIDPNVFFANRTKEEIVDLSIKYYTAMGLDVAPILKNSDLYEKPGKTQHAFCNNMNLDGDVRILCNIKPTAEWMDTQLHELGHAVYDYNINPELPCNLREPAHIFTTEGVAMLFGAMARNPQWLIDVAGCDPKMVADATEALHVQRLREQLLFCRWTIVMLYFEKALYENPEQDLKTLWWDMVEKYQMMPRPEDRHNAEWASKPHFVIAPVYYHNYMLGELFGAQLRASMGEALQSTSHDLGKQMVEKVFRPGAQYSWKEFVEKATGKPFSVKDFADELK